MQLAAKRGATVAGLDAAEGLIAVARERNPEADIRLGDLENLPFADGSFTAATSFNAVQYADDPRRALRELARGHRGRRSGRGRDVGGSGAVGDA
jgi:ubiquinone/menaquinone biosynthesis C-methylase UbiE